MALSTRHRGLRGAPAPQVQESDPRPMASSDVTAGRVPISPLRPPSLAALHPPDASFLAAFSPLAAQRRRGSGSGLRPSLVKLPDTADLVRQRPRLVPPPRRRRRLEIHHGPPRKHRSWPHMVLLWSTSTVPAIPRGGGLRATFRSSQTSWPGPTTVVCTPSSSTRALPTTTYPTTTSTGTASAEAACECTCFSVAFAQRTIREPSLTYDFTRFVLLFDDLEMRG